MKRLRIDRRKLLRFFGVVAAALLMLSALVLIPLKTHRAPVQEPRPPERLVRPTPSPQPVPTPDIFESYMSGDPQRDETLCDMLDDFCEQNQGTWDLYVMNLSHGEYAESAPEGNPPMVSASLIKLFIMGAVFDQIRAGDLTYYNCRYLLRDMVAKSDNYCANLLIRYLGGGIDEEGMEAVNAFALSIGCADTRLNRKMMEEGDEQNYTTAKDCAHFLKMLYRYELVSPEYSATMLEILKGQMVNNRIPAGLPKGTVCAHKTGDLLQICCGDAALVFTPNADYILTAICNYPENDQDAITAIAGLSAQIYEYYNPSPEETAEATQEP